MEIIFTTSSDISDGVILTFDMKNRDIRINDHRSHEGSFEMLPMTVDDLFEESCQSRVSRMVFNELAFSEEVFEDMIRKFEEMNDCGRLPLQLSEDLAVEVSVENYSVVIERNVSFKTMTRHEFVRVLLGLLNCAQHRLYCRKLSEGVHSSV